MSQIAAAIGCSRNAVIGKVHRLGLERFVGRATPPRQQASTTRVRSPRLPPPLVEVVEATTLAPPPWVVGHARKQIIELRSDECRWPIGEPGEDFCFCAEPNLTGSSYCSYHDGLSRERKRR